MFKQLYKNFYQKIEFIIQRFVKFPVPIKILLSFILLSISFSTILPFLAIIALIVTIFKPFGKIFKNIDSAIIILLLIISFSALLLLLLLLTKYILSFFILIFSIDRLFFASYLNLAPYMNFIKWFVLLCLVFVIILQFLLTKDVHKESLMEEIKEDSLKSEDIDLMKKVMSEASKGWENKNPILWLLKGRFRVYFLTALQIAFGILGISLFMYTLNSLFPNTFFFNFTKSPDSANTWYNFLLNLTYKVIPGDFISPFIEESKIFEVTKPYGAAVVIIIQIIFIYYLYISIYNIYFTLKLYKTNKKKKWKKNILKDINKKLKKYPNNIRFYLERMLYFTRLGDWESALMDCNKVLAIEPNNYYALINKGTVLEMIGTVEEAIEYYDKAIEIDPNNYSAWNSKGDALVELKKIEEGMKCYDKSMKLGPDNYEYEAWNNKGEQLSELGKYKVAIECYDKAIEIKPDYQEAWINISIDLKKDR